MDKKLTLPFVNEGKPFTVSATWTVEKHKQALQAVIRDHPKASNDTQDDLFKYYVVYFGLKEIDSNIDFEEIQELHADNLIALFNIIYTKGKVDIFFRQKQSKKKKK